MIIMYSFKKEKRNQNELITKYGDYNFAHHLGVYDYYNSFGNLTCITKEDQVEILPIKVDELLNQHNKNSYCKLKFGDQFEVPLFYDFDEDLSRLVGRIRNTDAMLLVAFEGQFLEIFVVSDGWKGWRLLQDCFVKRMKEMEELLNEYRALVYLDEEVENV